MRNEDGHRFTSNPRLNKYLEGIRGENNLPHVCSTNERQDDDGHDFDDNESMCSYRTFDSRDSETWTGAQFIEHCKGNPEWRSAGMGPASSEASEHEVLEGGAGVMAGDPGPDVWENEHGLRCYHCNVWGHSARSCALITCHSCDVPGHIRRDCWMTCGCKACMELGTVPRACWCRIMGYEDPPPPTTAERPGRKLNLKASFQAGWCSWDCDGGDCHVSESDENVKRPRRSCKRNYQINTGAQRWHGRYPRARSRTC